MARFYPRGRGPAGATAHERPTIRAAPTRHGRDGPGRVAPGRAGPGRAGSCAPGGAGPGHRVGRAGPPGRAGPGHRAPSRS
ncbi:MAG: hypothetical protein EKK42_01975 [Pseudonocardiaceae bacterium]|nr:MAG: hypothetical protein EKK42_01975 [Pseudonocardiaceae bacterium]